MVCCLRRTWMRPAPLPPPSGLEHSPSPRWYHLVTGSGSCMWKSRASSAHTARSMTTRPPRAGHFPSLPSPNHSPPWAARAGTGKRKAAPGAREGGRKASCAHTRHPKRAVAGPRPRRRAQAGDSGARLRGDWRQLDERASQQLLGAERAAQVEREQLLGREKVAVVHLDLHLLAVRLLRDAAQGHTQQRKHDLSRSRRGDRSADWAFTTRGAVLPSSSATAVPPAPRACASTPPLGPP